MKNRWLIIGLMISIAFNSAFIGAFVYRLWNQKQRPDRKSEKKILIHNDAHDLIQHSLKLDQKKRLLCLQKHFHPKIHDIRKELKGARDTLFFLIVKDSVDTNAINHQIEMIGNMQIEIEKEVIQGLLTEREVLDRNQRTHFFKILRKHLRDDRPPLHSSGVRIIQKRFRLGDDTCEQTIEIHKED